MNGGLSQLGTALTVVFGVTLVALLAELAYVLCRRRLVLRQPSLPAVHGGGFPEFSSKEMLMLYFCLNTRCRVEPDRALAQTNGSSPDISEEVIDVFKQRNVYGPSRVLFTIKEEEEAEEEREDLESDNLSGKGQRNSTAILEIIGESVPEPKPEVAVTIIEFDFDGYCCEEVTPFSTPCSSPVYFTPEASPAREEMDRLSTDTLTKVEAGST